MRFHRDDERLIVSIYSDIGGPFSEVACKKVTEGDWKGLLALKADPRSYDNALSYAKDAAVAALLRKCPDLPIKVDRADAAKVKWRDGERSCYLTNLRLAPLLARLETGIELSSDEEPVRAQAWSIVLHARKVIADWIGSSPPNLIAGRLGPGATYSDRGREITPLHKMSSNPTMTPLLWPFLPQWLGTAWGAAVAARGGELVRVPGNRYSTAPKTALTDRSIAVEPALNMFYQLGLGAELRKRLRRNANWDLGTAQEKHRQLACFASEHPASYCTLDLSNASDTVCKSLVRLLLPQRWHQQLSWLRSPKTLIDGKWCLLEKFSSMGNGYTFELETIIFAALCTAVMRVMQRTETLGRGVYVYGDDIIVPDATHREVIACLRFFGFALNEEKSFVGPVPFRESCGGDYFDGEPVRPFYIGDYPNEPQELIVLANGLTRLHETLARLGASGVRRSWFKCLDLLPAPIRRIRGPKALGDLVIHDDEVSRWTTRTRVDRPWTRYVKVYRPVRKIHRADSYDADVQFACALYGALDSTIGGLIPRGGVSGYKEGWVPYS